MPDRRGQPVHLRLVGDRDLDRAEAPHRAVGRVVRVRAGRVDQGVGDHVGAAADGRRVEDHRPLVLDA